MIETGFLLHTTLSSLPILTSHLQHSSQDIKRHHILDFHSVMDIHSLHSLDSE